MRVYLDVSCLNRPLDDQSQPRIRREAEAVITLLEQIAAHTLECAFSEIAAVEIDANRDPERRRRVRGFLPDDVDQRMLNDGVLARARVLRAAGMASADALHVAFAEDAAVDVFLTCDDKVCRFARRNPHFLNVLVENPANWIEERNHGTDA